MNKDQLSRTRHKSPGMVQAEEGAMGGDEKRSWRYTERMNEPYY